MALVQSDLNHLVLGFKALSDKNRITIIMLLKDGELCARDLLNELAINQSTLSHHMKILADAELVTVRKEGKWSFYETNEVQINKLIYFLNMKE